MPSAGDEILFRTEESLTSTPYKHCNARRVFARKGGVVAERVKTQPARTGRSTLSRRTR